MAQFFVFLPVGYQGTLACLKVLNVDAQLSVLRRTGVFEVALSARPGPSRLGSNFFAKDWAVDFEFKKTWESLCSFGESSSAFSPLFPPQQAR